MTSRRATACTRQTRGRRRLPRQSAVRIWVRGQVQGVGFRPFVHRLAVQCGLAGCVSNTAEGVVIEIEGARPALARFQHLLQEQLPIGAVVSECRHETIALAGRGTFAIATSVAGRQPAVRMPRDAAVCPACLQDVRDRVGRRFRYPFTTCTACGPRYSIIEALPYDRIATAMRQFTECAVCHAERRAPADRRFHAQANACPACGPQVALWNGGGATVAERDDAITAAARLLAEGKVLALKGLGGFQLLVRADQCEPVRRLRDRKRRPAKPFAVMTPTLQTARDLAELSSAEGAGLTARENPIVLVDRRHEGLAAHLAPEVAPRTRTLGLFLPTTPLHDLLLAQLPFPVVATSGNRCEEPIVIDERQAVTNLGGIADAFLVHNRPIVRRLDDSVVRVIAGRPTTLRLARGYAPWPLPALELDQGPPVLAVGGHQKAAIAFFSSAQALLGPHVGDLDLHAARQAYEAFMNDSTALFGFRPTAIACDSHPDYFTTQWAGRQRVELIFVQHHHAHAAACMAENDLLSTEVLAFTWDGAGYGPDGAIWGGECLRARREDYDRVASLLPFPLPGGEAAIRKPARVAFGLLHLLLGPEELLGDEVLLGRLGLGRREASLLVAIITRGMNTPTTSSVGRLFDAVAALALGIDAVSYEGEAAVALEAAADEAETAGYDLPLRTAMDWAGPVGTNCDVGDWRPMLAAILKDVKADVEPGIIAGRFHDALANWALAVAERHPGLPIVLSGGCFQNRLLSERVQVRLRERGRSVYVHTGVPPGDGGLAVGQLAVARAVLARRRV